MFDPSMGDVKSFEEIQNRFHTIAKVLMSNYDIELRHLYRERLRISSVELYLYKNSVWEDPTTHYARYGIRDQLTSGCWYVHRYKENGKFRPPRRRGIDITAGSNSHDVYAGLLIREVNEIDGPARAVNSMLFGSNLKSVRRNWNYAACDEFFLSLNGGSIYAGSVALVDALIPRSSNFYVGRRIGLPEPKTPKDETYVNSNLRIATHPGAGLSFLAN